MGSECAAEYYDDEMKMACKLDVIMRNKTAGKNKKKKTTTT